MTRLPARRMRRVRTSPGREGEFPTSNRSWTAVATLFTFCPPGPEARTKCNWISRSSIEILRVTEIMSVLYTFISPGSSITVLWRIGCAHDIDVRPGSRIPDKLYSLLEGGSTTCSCHEENDRNAPFKPQTRVANKRLSSSAEQGAKTSGPRKARVFRQPRKPSR